MSNNLQNINISPQNVQGKCDLKCSYIFKYPESNLTAKNNDSLIKLTYDNNGSSPVLYNNQKYNVSNIQIVCPSIHIFNGVTSAAEIIIEHAPVTGGPNLHIGIPIVQSSESSTATNYITEIIQMVSSNAPSSGETINLNISSFTLDNIIPKKPFFVYNESDTISWIIFQLTDAIPLSSNTLSTLSQIIKPFPLPTPGSNLFFNSHGPNTGQNIGDGIYISCQPTGSSQDEVPIEYSKNSTSYDLTSNSTFILGIQILLGCIIFVLIFVGFNYAYNYLINTPIKMPPIKIPNLPNISFSSKT